MGVGLVVMVIMMAVMTMGLMVRTTAATIAVIVIICTRAAFCQRAALLFVKPLVKPGMHLPLILQPCQDWVI